MSYKEAMKRLAEENSRLNDKLTGIDKATQTRDVMLSIIGDISMKVKASPPNEAKAWYIERLRVLMKCLSNVEWMVAEMESMDKAIRQLSDMNDTYLEENKRLNEQLDHVFDNM